ATVQQAAKVAANSSFSFPAALDPLLEVHAGFRASRTVVLHKFGTDPNYDAWRSRALNRSVVRNLGTSAVDMLIPAPLPGRLVVTETEMQVLPSTPGVNMLIDAAPVPAEGRKVAASADGRAEARIQEIRSALLASNPNLGQSPLQVGAFV